MPSVSVKDVSQQAFTVALAAHFKKTGKILVKILKKNSNLNLKIPTINMEMQVRTMLQI